MILDSSDSSLLNKQKRCQFGRSVAEPVQPVQSVCKQQLKRKVQAALLGCYMKSRSGIWRFLMQERPQILLGLPRKCNFVGCITVGHCQRFAPMNDKSTLALYDGMGKNPWIRKVR